MAGGNGRGDQEAVVDVCDDILNSDACLVTRDGLAILDTRKYVRFALGLPPSFPIARHVEDNVYDLALSADEVVKDYMRKFNESLVQEVTVAEERKAVRAKYDEEEAARREAAAGRFRQWLVDRKPFDMRDLAPEFEREYFNIIQREREAVEARQRALRLEDAETWIRDHGSERLQLAVKAGLLDKSLGAYRDERMALERPGWRRWDSDADDHPIVNPGLDALRALDRAKREFPDSDVELLWAVWTDDDGDKIRSGAVLSQTFLGQALMKEVDCE